MLPCRLRKKTFHSSLPILICVCRRAIRPRSELGRRESFHSADAVAAMFRCALVSVESPESLSPKSIAYDSSCLSQACTSMEKLASRIIAASCVSFFPVFRSRVDKRKILHGHALGRTKETTSWQSLHGIFFRMHTRGSRNAGNKVVIII